MLNPTKFCAAGEVTRESSAAHGPPQAIMLGGALSHSNSIVYIPSSSPNQISLMGGSNITFKEAIIGNFSIEGNNQLLDGV